MGLFKIATTGVLLLLAVLLIVSLMTNDVDLWIMWSRLGDEEFYAVVTAVLYYLLPQLQQGLTLVTALLLSGSLNMALKYTLNLSRPPNPLIDVSGPSFPSGHAQISSSFWSSLSLMMGDLIVIIISLIIITGISLSRVSLRAHYAVDVIAGAFIGCAVGCASYLALKYRSKKGSLVGYRINIGVAVALSTYNVMVLRAELDSSTVLLGLGLAALTALPVLKFVERVKPPILTRLLACAISIALLLGSHIMTMGCAPYIRLACFYAVGLCIFSMALAFQALFKRLGGKP